MAQKQGFWIFEENDVISFAWNYWKTKIRIVLEKIWFSANEISVFLNHQYFINRLIFDFDFWYKNRHERKEQGLLASSLKKKKLIWAYEPFWPQKWRILITPVLL